MLTKKEIKQILTYIVIVILLFALCGNKPANATEEYMLDYQFGSILRETQLDMDMIYSRAKHIACQEGYYKKGTRAERQNNPGNLKAGGKTDEVNHTIFATPTKGWLRLYQLLYKYQDLTLEQIGKFYAEDKAWAYKVRRCNPPIL